MAGTRSVGLLIMTEVPDMGLCAVLQRRGEYNFEKSQPESYPGACQVTVHGKVKDGENEEGALYRETREELGDKFTDEWLSSHRPNRPNLFLASVTDAVKTFVTQVPYETVSRIRLHASSGGLFLVKEGDVDHIRSLNPSDKHCRAVDLVMFEDEIRAMEAMRGVFLYFLTFSDD